MITATVIIVGGGPAGASCAGELRKKSIDTLILDKALFPRQKLCAGWITPTVLTELEITPGDYPHRLLTYQRLLFYFRGIRVPARTRQYSIRRLEFDEYLLKRAGVPVYQHHVNHINKSGKGFIIDNKYKCTYLVGAGGTHCPVYKTLFTDIHPRDPKRLIATAEEEFPFNWADPECRLWFFDRGLPGYAWYVPKQNGYLNIGIGGKQAALKKRGETIKTHWRHFITMLSKTGPAMKHQFSPRGHVYYLKGKSDRVQRGNAFITGDAAGLATRDMGEGIGPAIKSGKLAARAIITGMPYSISSVNHWSLPEMLLPDALSGCRQG